MNKNELQTILGYLNIGLAIAHDTGVSVGHFGSTDFIQLAQAVNSVLLQAIVPAAAAATAAATTTTATASVSAPAAAAAAAPVAVATVAVSSPAAAN